MGTNQTPFAVITGASRGIGAEYARALAGKGYDLLLVSRDKARLEQIVSGLRRQSQQTVDYEVLDLAEPDAAHRLFAAARQRQPVPALLINNAGFGLFGEFITMPMARIQAMLRLHVNTIVESIRLFLPGMVEQGAGGIVTVSSVAGFHSVPYLAEYAATKAFLISFSEALAEEVRATGVRIQVCCPGTTATDFHETAGFKLRNPVGAQTPADVVAESLAALECGPVVVTTGFTNRLLVRLSRLVPSSWRTKMAGRWTKPPTQERNT